MIERIVSRPVSVVIATLALSTLGVFSLFKLPLSLLPSIERPSLLITAKAAARSRGEMLHEVTQPVERRLPSVRGLTAIESETRPGESRIVVESDWQTDPDRLRIDVARRLESAVDVPLDELTVETRAADLRPIIDVAVTGGSPVARTRFAQQVLLPELARVPAAGDVELIGATPLRLTVEPNGAALAARGLTANDVARRLSELGRSEGGGRSREGASVRPVVVTDRVRSAADLAAIRIGSVPLSEVAAVRLQVVGDGTAFRTGGADGVLLRVHRAAGGNAVALARGVRDRVAELSRRTRDVRLRVVADRSQEVTRALIELIAAAVAGMLLGTLVLRFALRDWRPTLALIVVVPVALLASFSVFHAFGIPIDVVSLAGLALATGLLVDNSIVVLEAIETSRAAGAANPVVEGTRQIFVAVVASSITLVIVFTPLLYLRGLARAIFGEQAIAVVASVLASLLLSLTLTPVLAQRARIAAAAVNPGLSRYLVLLDRVSARQRLAFLVAAAVTAAAIAAGWFLPRELFARGPTRSLVMEFQPPALLDEAGARSLARRVWQAAATPQATLILPSDGTPGTLEVPATEISAAELGRRATSLAGIRTNVRVRRSSFIEAISGNADQVEIIVSAPTDGEAAALAARVSKEAQSRGLVPLPQSGRIPQTAMRVEWDEPRLASLRTSRRAAEEDVKAALGEQDLGRSDIPGTEPAIRLLPTQPADLRAVPVRVGEAVVPLAGVARIALANSEPVTDHDEGRPARRLLFRTTPRAEGQGPRADFQMSARERVRVAGHAAELKAAHSQMLLAAILAAVLLYLTVAAFYESLVLPLLVMMAIPFAAGGGLLALLVCGQSLNIMSIIGLIFLAGVVVNHTVVLLDRAEQLRRDGVEEDTALRLAAADRYRPVMMTTITAILGMLPLALLGGEGVELRRSIAIVVIGGLTTATAGTLLLIPLLHRVIEPYRRRRVAGAAPRSVAKRWAEAG